MDRPGSRRPPQTASSAMLKRHGVALLALALLLAVALVAFAPPTAAVGGTGWGVAAACLLATVALAARLATPGARVTRGEMSWMAFGSVAQIGLLQWLAGGLHAPYNELLLLAVFASGSVHPRHRLPPFLALVAAVALAPLAYDRWDAAVAGGTGAYVILLWGIALVSQDFARENAEQRQGLREAERRAAARARTDGVTGLGNRRAFDEVLAQEVARSARTGTPLSLVICDIDSFKEVNDRFGHITGDRLLREAAEALEATMRASDRVFRWGGDELAVLLPDTALAAARRVEGRLAAAVGDACAVPGGGRISISSGAAELGPGMSAGELVDAADRAMIGRKAARRAAGGAGTPVAPALGSGA